MLDAQCESFWREFVGSLAADDPRRQARPDAFCFGDDGELADALARLVLAGTKRATASLPIEYTALDEPLPRTGDLSIILDGTGRPVGIVERTSVELVSFGAVSEAFAAREGEGDGSLRFWREAHTSYFGRVCTRLGGTLDDATPILCQCFELVWPPAPGRAARGSF